jgi:PilZ domain-containing protein
MGSDRRFYPRGDVVFQVVYAEEPGKETNTLARDISASGVSFVTSELIPKNTVLNLVLHFKELPREICAEGRVVRSWSEGDKFFTAVEFTRIPYDDFVTVLDYSLTSLKLEE